MVTTNDYITMACTGPMIDAARKKLSGVTFDPDMDPSKFGSEELRTFFGYLGEQMVMTLLAQQDEDDFEYDLFFKGKRLEVKTISCKFRPPTHYLCAVNSCEPDGVHKQDADYYVFVRIKEDKSQGWILGYLPCNDFFDIGTFAPKGTTVAPGITFEKANGTVLEIEHLLPISELLALPA